VVWEKSPDTKKALKTKKIEEGVPQAKAPEAWGKNDKYHPDQMAAGIDKT